MANDLFNNPTNNYANPGFAPCIGDPDSNFFEFVKNGVGITSGSEILSNIDFSNLKIPVSSWAQQTRVINPGEVIFIQGLSKILTQKQLGFTMPTLVSTDEDLDKFFMEIDLSVNFYEGFGFVQADIDSSANYNSNIAVDDQLTIDFFNISAGTTSTYSSSILYFNGTVAGYEFDINNVTLTLIDASQNSASPFAANIINGIRQPIVYTLPRDTDSTILSAKHPNTASQGIVIKNIYPGEYNSSTISAFDKWLYLNHTLDTVTLYEPIDLTFLIDSSTDFIVVFDGSALIDYFGYTAPGFMVDISVADVSTVAAITIADVSVADSSTIIGTGFAATNISVVDSSITLSTILDSSILDSSIATTGITNSVMQNGYLEDSSTSVSFLKDVDVRRGIHTNLTADGDGTNILTDLVLAGNNSIGQYLISDVSVTGNNNLFRDSSINNINITTTTGNINHTFFNSTIDSSYSILESRFIESNIWNTTLSNVYLNNSNFYNDVIVDASIRDTFIQDSSLTNIYIQDSSTINTKIYTSRPGTGSIENIDASGGWISDSFVNTGNITNIRVLDSSLYDTIINNDSSINDSIIENSWINTHKLLVSTDASGNNTYLYVMDDPTLAIDSSAWRVNIANTDIWDTSINNANIYDSSIYSGYVQDSSLIRCVVYNTDIDRSTFVDSTTVMIDASIIASCNLQSDTSTYYRKLVKTLDIGLNGASTDTVISAGDYLEHITDNNLWSKVGDLYMWTSAPDSGVFSEINLINGFYLFNPHTFPISAEYLVIA